MANTQLDVGAGDPNPFAIDVEALDDGDSEEDGLRLDEGEALALGLRDGLSLGLTDARIEDARDIHRVLKSRYVSAPASPTGYAPERWSSDPAGTPPDSRQSRQTP